MKKIFSYILFWFLFGSDSFAVEFSLFGDAKLLYEQKQSSSFALGDLDFVIYEDLSETTSITADILFSGDSNQQYKIVVERLMLTKQVAEPLYFTLGKFHKPVGFWFHNFHHASLSQDTVSRPFFLEMQNSHEGVFPTHLIGLLVGGDGKLWSYQFGIANSNGINTEGIPGSDNTTSIQTLNFYDPSKSKTLVGRLTLGPKSGPLEFGFFAMRNETVELGNENTLVTPGDAVFKQDIYGANFNLSYKNFYLFAEYFGMKIEDNPAIDSPPYVAQIESYDAKAFYAQIGFRFGEHFATALRFESLNFDDNSTYFDLQGVPPESRRLLAFKYKFDESNALRFEINNAKQKNSDDTTVYAFQWIFYLL